MKLNSKDLAQGKYIGEEFWICDYRYNDFNNKPIRHVPPTKVNCLSKKETEKTVYYSECFFRQGEKKSSLIKLYDNTGYRSYPGIALEVFTTEKECIKAYSAQKEKLRKEFYKYKEQQLDLLDKIEKQLQIE